jgi:putative ABC transport system permease protein
MLGIVLVSYNTNFRVIGVADDFKYRGLGNRTEPVIFRGSESWSGYYSIKLDLSDNPQRNISEVISLARDQWEMEFRESPFDYFFLDDFFNAQYKSEVRFGRIFGLFSGLAIVIACLGLFGLSSYTISRRTREIGIRKVLGASVPNILLLLSRNYMVLILISFIIAVPASYLGITRWLDEFPAKFEPDPLLFIYPGIIVFILMILIISYQTLTTARSNPVDSIRTE